MCARSRDGVMAALKFIVKFFPEITIKSKPVRRQFVAQLRKNISRILRAIDSEVDVLREWDKITVVTVLVLSYLVSVGCYLRIVGLVDSPNSGPDHC